jgi:phosphatidylserine decarboxylase
MLLKRLVWSWMESVTNTLFWRSVGVSMFAKHSTVVGGVFEDAKQ